MRVAASAGAGWVDYLFPKQCATFRAGSRRVSIRP